MAVKEGIAGDRYLFAAGATQHISSLRRGATLFERRHGLQLSQTQSYCLSPHGPMCAEDARDFGHGCAPLEGFIKISE
jgi:hypothetical protein